MSEQMVATAISALMAGALLFGFLYLLKWLSGMFKRRK